MLGLGTTSNKSTPFLAGSDNKWVDIDGGSGHSAGLRSNGTLWSWGANTHGQLGDGTLVDKNSAVQSGTDNDWISISAGGDFTLALKIKRYAMGLGS
jgi:alpha-tubulin suppressor-like RCC1 family protein